MNSLIKFFLRLAHCSSGSALIESAITIPLAISLMVGGVDFGLAFYTQAIGSKSVRDAARYLGSLPIEPTSLACETWAQDNAKNLAVYGNQAGVGSPLIPNWQVDGGANNQVTITLSPSDCSTPPLITVTANFPYNTLMIAQFMPLGATVTLSARHEEQSVGG
jgi:Flp pilus assembly protein TadG